MPRWEASDALRAYATRFVLEWQLLLIAVMIAMIAAFGLRKLRRYQVA